MKRYPRPMIAAAVALAVLAGFIDAFAFTAMGGFFASFMSGNSTRLGVALGSGDLGDARVAAALILAFICGVVLAAIVSRRFETRRKPAVMAMATGFILLAAAAAGSAPGTLTLLLLAVAMGAENGVFNREGEVTMGVAYFTGTLVRFGQKLAAALMGEGDRWAWAPHGLLWLGFTTGVVSGARSYLAIGSGALWIAAAAAAALTLLLAVSAQDQASLVTEQ